MSKRVYIEVCFLLICSGKVAAQDPHLTQYKTAPSLVNPAFCGVFSGDYRFGSNYRQQWGSLSSPYTTMVVSVDGKLTREEYLPQSSFNAGVVIQSDKTLKGALVSNAISLNASYHVPLNEEGNKTLGLGLIGSYGKRNFNFSQLASGSQFTSGGFDLWLPSGEATFDNMKPYFSIGAGLLYSNSNSEEGTFFEVGAAAYHLNRPQQNILFDATSEIPMRFSAQANLQRYLGQDLLLDVRLLYQAQSSSDYLQAGVSVAKLLEEDVNGSLVGLGCSYRTSDAVSPALFTEFNSFRIGFSYDIHINDITKNNRPVSSMELSLQYRIKAK